MSEGAVKVKGLSGLQRDLTKYSKDLKKKLKLELIAVAEPVRKTAEMLAGANISHIGPSWERMRVGVTTRSVYVAPFSKSRKKLHRPNLANLLMDKAMQPALDQESAGIETALEGMLDRLGSDNGF